MTNYLAEVKDQLHYFGLHYFQWVDRSDNTVVEALSKLATTEACSFTGLVYLEVLDTPSIQKVEVFVIERSNGWLTPYLDYLNDGIFPSDWILIKKIKHRSSYFILIDGDLYRRAFSSPLLKCLVPSKATYVLREVHEEIYGDHIWELRY